MIEDKLTHDERLRLECLAQAINYTRVGSLGGQAEVINTAEVFEKFVRGEER